MNRSAGGGPQRRWPALRVSAYRWYWGGGLISDVGNWVQTTTIPFVVYQLTHDARWVGIAGFTLLGAQVVTVLPGGHLADRGPRLTLLMSANLVMFVLAAALARVAGRGAVHPWEVIAIATLMAMVFGIQQPAWQTLPAELVPTAAADNAAHLTITKFQAARAIGPLVAGGLLAGPGVVWTFAFNAVSFVPVLVALVVISRRTRGSRRPDTALGYRAVDESGFREAWSQAGVAVAVVLTAMMAALGMPVVPLATILASSLHAGPGSYGVLVSAFGWGALSTSIAYGAAGHRWSRARGTAAGMVCFGVALVVLGAIPRYAVAVAAMALAGMGMASAVTNLHGAVQALPPARLRGRSVAMYLLALRVGAGAGILAQAWLASATSVAFVLDVAGGGLLLLGGALAMQRTWIHELA